MTVPVAASCWADPTFVTSVAGLGVGARPLEDDPAVEPGEVLGIGQPDVDRGHAARGEVVREGLERRALRGPAVEDHAASSGR